MNCHRFDVTLIALLALAAPLAAAERVLIVADEIPAMEALVKHLQAKAGADSKIVTQAEMPASVEPFGTIIVYVHRELFEGPEKAILEHTRAGGRLIVIHHSISSGKRKNKEWLPSFRVTLPTEKLEAGGYGYYAPATFDVVNLAPKHPVTSRGVKYEKQVTFSAGGVAPEKQCEAFTVAASEIFLNHRLEGPRTPLLGLKWTDPRSGKEYMQATAGWQMPLAKGSVYYFMVGHRVEDFAIAPYVQILANALQYR